MLYGESFVFVDLKNVFELKKKLKEDRTTPRYGGAGLLSKESTARDT